LMNPVETRWETNNARYYFSTYGTVIPIFRLRWSSGWPAQSTIPESQIWASGGARQSESELLGVSMVEGRSTFTAGTGTVTINVLV
jgi:hypothetical protein